MATYLRAIQRDLVVLRWMVAANLVLTVAALVLCR